MGEQPVEPASGTVRGPGVDAAAGVDYPSHRAADVVLSRRPHGARASDPSRRRRRARAVPRLAVGGDRLLPVLRPVPAPDAPRRAPLHQRRPRRPGRARGDGRRADRRGRTLRAGRPPERPSSRSRCRTPTRAAASARCCSSTSRRRPVSVGLERFVAEVLPNNRRMLATFVEAGYRPTQRVSDGVVSLTFDIEPTPQSAAVRAAREHLAESRSIARLLRAALGRRGRRRPAPRRPRPRGRCATSSTAASPATSWRSTRRWRRGDRRRGAGVPPAVRRAPRRRPGRRRRAGRGGARGRRRGGPDPGCSGSSWCPPGSPRPTTPVEQRQADLVALRARLRDARRRPECAGAAQHCARGEAERVDRAPPAGSGPGRLLLPERSARRRHPGAGGRARRRRQHLRLGGKPCGRLRQRPDAVLGGRPGHRRSSCSTWRASATRASSPRIARRLSRRKPVLASPVRPLHPGAAAGPPRAPHDAATGGARRPLRAVGRDPDPHAHRALRRRCPAHAPATARRSPQSRSSTNSDALAVLAADAIEATGLHVGGSPVALAGTRPRRRSRRRWPPPSRTRRSTCARRPPPVRRHRPDGPRGADPRRGPARHHGGRRGAGGSCRRTAACSATGRSPYPCSARSRRRSQRSRPSCGSAAWRRAPQSLPPELPGLRVARGGRAAGTARRRAAPGRDRAAELRLRAQEPGDELSTLLAAYGIGVRPSVVVTAASQAVQAARRLGYPVALTAIDPENERRVDGVGVRLDLYDDRARARRLAVPLRRARPRPAGGAVGAGHGRAWRGLPRRDRRGPLVRPGRGPHRRRCGAPAARGPDLPDPAADRRRRARPCHVTEGRPAAVACARGRPRGPRAAAGPRRPARPRSRRRWRGWCSTRCS